MRNVKQKIKPLHKPKMNSMRTNVANFRLKRKCVIISVHCLFTLCAILLLSPEASCRPSQEEYDELAAEYANDDGIEWNHNEILDGLAQSEEHPVIYYKEDYVSEDYDPAHDNHGSRNGLQRPQRQRVGGHRLRHNRSEAEHYRVLKPEKIYFDVLPQAPLVVPDDLSASDSKFDDSEIRIEVLSLADNTKGMEDENTRNSKEVLNKRPKKYTHRQRRDVSETGQEHSINKRNPSYTQTEFNSLLRLFQTFDLMNQQQATQIRHPVKGIYHNTISPPGPTATKAVKPDEIGSRFGDENETDRVVWRTRQSARSTTQRPVPPLFHDPSPQNWDTSFMNKRPQTTTTTQRPVPPLFHDSNPENWDTSFLTRRPPTQSPTTSRPIITTNRPARVAPTTTVVSEEATISVCVWAIVQCCSRQSLRIRYECFEAVGCYGAFWGLNPCAERVQDNVANYVGEYFS